MEVKKSSRADLQQFKSIFFLIGLIVAIGATFLVFNIKSSYELDPEITTVQGPTIEQEEIPLTQQEEKKPEVAAPEAPKVIDKINLVKHEVKLDTEVDPFESEFSEGTAVDVYVWDEGSGEEEVDEEEIFIIVEDYPSFQGGDLNKFREYVQKVAKYPESAAEIGLQGRVQVTFVVEKDGTVSNVKVLRGVDPILDKEAVRAVKSSPKWTPGKQRGKPVRVGYTIPVLFFLRS